MKLWNAYIQNLKSLTNSCKEFMYGLEVIALVVIPIGTITALTFHLTNNALITLLVFVPIFLLWFTFVLTLVQYLSDNER